MKVTAEQRKALEATGVQLNYGVLNKTEYTLREVARICDFAEAWVRTKVKAGKIMATKNERGHWRVKKAEVIRVRQEQLEKQLNRLEAKKTGKKYLYRRPSEWAHHLMMKAIRSDTTLTPAAKKKAINMVNRYKDRWDQEYKERLAKKEANAAKAGK